MPHQLQSGVIPAIMMPFHTDESVDWATYDRYIGDLASTGPAGIAVNMAAAEATALELDEQVDAVKRAKAIVNGDCPIVSGVIAPYTAGAVDRAKRLVDAGADAVVVFPPLPTFMSKPLPVSIVADYHRTVAEACPCPVIAFQTANAGYPVGTLQALAEIDNVIAIKDAAFDIDRTWEIVEEAEETGGRIAVLTGNDTFILEAYLLGCAGALIGFASTATALNIEMQRLAAQKKATEAYEIWERLGPLARLCWSAPLRDYRPRMKYVLMRQGVFPSDTTRAPQTTISDSDRAKVDALFQRYGFADAAYLPRAH